MMQHFVHLPCIVVEQAWPVGQPHNCPERKDDDKAGRPRAEAERRSGIIVGRKPAEPRAEEAEDAGAFPSFGQYLSGMVSGLLVRLLDEWDTSHPLQRTFKDRLLSADPAETEVTADLSFEDYTALQEELLFMREEMSKRFKEAKVSFPYMNK